MVIDIRRTILRKNLRAFILVLVFIALILLLLLTDLYYDQLFGLTNYHIAIIIAGLYILIILFNAFRQYNYIYYTDLGENIVLRYFSTGVMTHKKNSIEIPKTDFAGYEKKRWLFGYREKIVLKIRSPKGAASFAPVSLTALTSQEKQRIYESLDRIKH